MVVATTMMMTNTMTEAAVEIIWMVFTTLFLTPASKRMLVMMLMAETII